ncbi:hypothetical protein C2S52_022078 [Perilla frutescens var. hirtella]|uniref:Uncharacterized protein n=1 Tax=Perilla frutescens var. hirtella TaxID=608512 RepID=A0AAD4IQ28_PERFH|nr:hypothetical protein C2S53_001082 [Perilla frutescens var. hirtella]KAH6797524.1 hypothetical protein C2S52_022078 [Perilla frutescens var. hirtella]KAH6807515.1 hypothetical protein C2S51_028623 [Perilla frutescens var. frutescens]
MARQIVLRSSASSVSRRQPLLNVSDYHPQGGLAVRLAEVVGGTTAECAAVCCCCPCGLVDLLVLAMCKVPAGLCRKALRRKRRRRLMRMGMLPSRKCSCDEKDFQIHPIAAPTTTSLVESVPENVEVVDLDNEMFEQFFSGGFWRSSSARM